ncbi:Leucine-rich repeat [Trypanosoma melophagium]|uniref:Leucine-rich repeat n=1 Tax=Trypanosoma melophagium TaxID=715481 RepID=UPI003519F3FB|nr:Leucine-rich repeat [Trypanosoma melophagium]
MKIMIREESDTFLGYSSRGGESARDTIHYFVPPAYTRHPLPLQETRAYFTVHNDVNTETVIAPSRDPLGIFTDEDGSILDTKHNLLESLLGQPEHIHSLQTTIPQIRDIVASRLCGSHCNATFIEEAQMLAQLVSCILTGQRISEGANFECIASIDLSHTVLGVVGSQKSPYYADKDGNPIPRSSGSRVLAFFPNETNVHDKRKSMKKYGTAHCSLAFAYTAPLLWTPGGSHFNVTELTCQHCFLGDHDAKALAFILRKRQTQGNVCVLERIDLSFNKITNIGAEALKKAVKYNKHVKTLNLTGNEGIIDLRILHLIQKRLQRNKEGQKNLNCFQQLKRWLKG